MKKLLIIISFFITSFIFAQDKESFFVSNYGGMIFAPCSSTNNAEYVIGISKTNTSEYQKLYKNSTLIKTFLKTFDSQDKLTREAVEENGKLISEILYDDNLYPKTERIFTYNNDKVELTEIEYYYENSRLIKKETTVNNITTTSLYFYNYDGRLSQLKESNIQTGKSLYSGNVLNKSGTSLQWYETEKYLYLNKYNTDGHLIEVSVYDGIVLKSREIKTWDNNILLQSQTTYDDGHIETREYIVAGQAQGKIASSTIKKNNLIIEKKVYHYDDQGVLVKSEKKIENKLYISEYFYNKEQKNIQIDTKLNGMLTSRIIFKDNNTKIEESYNQGVLFARIYYDDDRRVLEEVIKNDNVIRVRKF